MAKVIEGLYYSESHEYVKVEGDEAYVGITDYAQEILGNIVYVDMPEVDDEFAAEVSDFDTLAEYRADLEKKMQEAADAQAEEAARQTLVDSVVRAAECDVPAPMVEEKLDDMMQQMGWRMQQQGFSMEQYLKLIGQTEQQMRDMYRSEALNNVKTELVIDEIIKAEQQKPIMVMPEDPLFQADR